MRAQVHRSARACGALHHANSQLWLRTDLTCHLIGAWHQLIIINDFIHDTESLGFIGLDEPSCPEQLKRLRHSDKPGQIPGAAIARK